jgi:hypothetical protein
VLDIEIRQSGKILAKLEERYANEVASWSDHINLLKKVRKYSITTDKEVILDKRVTHYRTRIVLPIL